MRRSEALNMNISQHRGKSIFAKGQVLAEAAIVLATAGLAILAMQVYIQRGIQGKTKFLTDKIIGKDQRAYTAVSEHSRTRTDSFDKTKVSTKRGGSVKKEIITEDTTVNSYSWSKDKQ